MKINSFTLFLGLLLIILSCKPSSSKIEIHPNSENLNKTHDNAIGYLNSVDSTNQVIRELMNRDLSSVIPSDSNSSIILGRVNEIEVGSNRIFILDSEQFKVFVFDYQGQLIDVIGGQGKGPSEFRDLRSITVIDDKALYLSDAVSGISKFKFNGSTYVYERDVMQDVGFDKISSTNSNLYASKTYYQRNANDSLKTITEYNINNLEPKKKFGNAYIDENIDTIFSLSESMFYITDTVLIFTKFFDPYIYGYDLKTSDLKWSTFIENLEFPKFIEKPGSFVIDEKYIDEIPSDFISSINQINESHILVQYASKVYKQKYSNSIIKSYLININDGSGRYVNTQLPLFKHIDERYSLTYSDFPFQLIKMYE